MRRASENVTSWPARPATSAWTHVPLRDARNPRARATGPASRSSRSAIARNGAMSSSTASRKRRRSSAVASSGAASATRSAPSLRCAMRACAGPAGSRKDELRAVVEQPQRPVADSAERHPEGYGPRGRISISVVTARARQPEAAHLQSREPPRRAWRRARDARADEPPGRAAGRATRPRRAGGPPRTCRPAGARPRRGGAGRGPTTLRSSVSVTSSYVPVPAKQARRAAARSAGGPCGGLAGSHGAQLGAACAASASSSALASQR